MSENKLPDKLPVSNACGSSAELDLRNKTIEYNGLPKEDPRRATIYKEIQELSAYSQDWD